MKQQNKSTFKYFIYILLYLQNNFINTETISIDLIKQYLPRNPIILECGAYKGEDTEKLSAKIPNATIYAFEAVPSLYKIITNKKIKNAHIFPYALGFQNGITNFYISSGTSDGSSSILKPKKHLEDHPNVKFNNIIQVPCKTIDTWAEENNIAKVDFLWLDMQGAEYLTLRASPKILGTVTVIQTEVSLNESYEGVSEYPVFKRWLMDQGFKVIKEEIPWSDAGDVLFVRKTTE